MNKEILKKGNSGITLIALVITIIVLLILAGVVIATLTGENGILNRAADAKGDTTEAQAKEEVQLAILESMAEKNGYDKADIIERLTKLGATVTENGDTLTVEYKGYKFTVDAKGTVTTEGNNNNNTASLPSTDETSPWKPEGTEVTENDLSKGITVAKKDADNNIVSEWTWVVVPKTVTAEVAAVGAEEDPTNSALENALKSYAATTVTDRGNYTDTWYSEAQTGMTSEQYTSKKRSMLNSIKEHGGFWIGKYEVGYTETEYRTSSNKANLTQTPVIIQNAYPYNYVTCAQAEGIAESLTSGLGGTGSLMFGTQWDLVLKYLNENAGVDPNNSTSWGNHSDTTLTINSDSAYQSINDRVWPSIAKDATSKGKLLTTGAAEDTTNKLNIVDLAGNVSEWTLEWTHRDFSQCTFRGGYYSSSGSGTYTASFRDYATVDSGMFVDGLRPSLY